MRASVFLDNNNTVKLGDFGLSKQLAQASFANTYVGVSVVIHNSLLTLTVFSPPNRLHTICPPNSCKKKPTTQNQIYGRSDA